MRDPAGIMSSVEEEARQARNLLGNPALQAAVASLTDRYTTQWRTSLAGPLGEEQRETAHLLIRALDALLEDLRATVSGAEITRHNLGPRLSRLDRR